MYTCINFNVTVYYTHYIQYKHAFYTMNTCLIYNVSMNSIVCLHSMRNGCDNTPPPRSLHANILPHLSPCAPQSRMRRSARARTRPSSCTCVRIKGRIQCASHVVRHLLANEENKIRPSHTETHKTETYTDSNTDKGIEPLTHALSDCRSRAGSRLLLSPA
jgi:hypothetical protein